MNAQGMSDQQTAEVNYSFGQRLSSARRALNLTQEQVAAELRLNISLIKALEEEDYTNLPAQMYIAGYLRNYARLLKIPVEPLLSALDKAQLESPNLITDATLPRKASQSRLFVKLFVLAVLVVVVAGIVSWLQSQDLATLLTKLDEAVQSKANTLPGVPTADESITEDVSSAAEASEPKVIKEPVAAPVEEVSSPAAAVVEESIVEETTQQESAAPETAPQETSVQETSVQEPAALSKPSPILIDGVPLVLSFKEDCWTEVSDSRGKRLAYDLYREGQTKAVTGIPPFSIFLGNAIAVTIKYNGQPYDASEHIHANLARFQLGRAEDYKGTTE